jgi:hypothetical protein
MRFRSVAVFASAVLSLTSIIAPSHAETGASDSSFTVGGRLYTDHYFATRSNSGYRNGIIQSSVSGWLDFQSNLSQRTSFQAIGQFDIFARNMTSNDRATISGRVREGVFTFQTESIQFKIGQQIIPWGKSDGVNPTDYFSSKDYTLLNPDEEVKRQGAPAMMLSLTPKQGTSPITFTGVFQAAYPQQKLMIPDRAVPTGIQFTKYASAPELFREESMEYGGKIAYLGNTFDLSLSVFRGVNHFSQYIYDVSQNRVIPQNFLQSAVGGDFSFTSGDFVVRGESAYFVPDQGPANSALYRIVQPSHWDTIIGVERGFLDDFRAQVQFLYRYHFDYQDPSTITTPSPVLTQIQQTVARANALLLNFQRESNPGATFRIGYASDSSDWTADLFLVGYFAKGYDYLLRPQVSYKPGEGWKLMAGADLYGGNESRPLGALRNNSSLFLEGRYVF